MVGIRGFIRSLVPGNDHALAAEQYAGHESASDKARRKRIERYRRDTSAARQGQAWEDRQR